MACRQRELTLKPRSRGCHLITHEIESLCDDLLRSCEAGVCHIFIKHTSASLTINENADPTVRQDMELALNNIVPETWPYRHDSEGSDDMPAHVKSSLMGSNVTIPVVAGRLGLGTWQGIYLNEHRDLGSARSLIVSIIF